MLICGRFEGIDERILWLYNIEEISVGDYVLSGGEVAALVIMDSCIRIIKGVLKNEETIKNEYLTDIELSLAGCFPLDYNFKNIE